MNDRSSIAQTKASLSSVGFKHIVPQFADLVHTAEEQKLTYRGFLDLLIEQDYLSEMRSIGKGIFPVLISLLALDRLMSSTPASWMAALLLHRYTNSKI